MNSKEPTTLEAVSTDSRILIKSQASFFLLPAIISSLLTASILFLILWNLNSSGEDVPEQTPEQLSFPYFLLILVFFTLRFGWLAYVYFKAPKWLLFDFENRTLTIEPDTQISREIPFDDIQYIRYFYNLFYVLSSFNFSLRMKNRSKSIPLLLAMRSDPMSNALYFALQNRGGIEMRQDSIASVVRPKQRSGGRKPDLHASAPDTAPVMIQSERHDALFTLGGRNLLFIVLIFLANSVLALGTVTVILLTAVLVALLIHHVYFSNHSSGYWTKKIEFDSNSRVINEYLPGQTVQTSFDDVEYIRFNTFSGFSTVFTDYLFWIKQKGIKERPLFSVTKDKVATAYYFFLQNELGLPMRQD